MISLNFLKFKEDSFALKNISKLCANFWDNYFKFLFLLFSLVVLFLGVYFWFQISYQSDWNSDQKKQYQSSQSKEVDLKEQQLKKVVEEYEGKKKVYASPIEISKDIFDSYFVEEKPAEIDIQNATPSSNVIPSANSTRVLP